MDGEFIGRCHLNPLSCPNPNLCCLYRAASPSRIWEGHVLMKFSSSFVVPSTVLSTASRRAPRQRCFANPAAGSRLPNHNPCSRSTRRNRVEPMCRSGSKHAPASDCVNRRTSTAEHAFDAVALGDGEDCQPGEVRSSCNGGCASSFPSGKDPWGPVSGGGTNYGPFSRTCRDTITHTFLLRLRLGRGVRLKTETRPLVCQQLQAGKEV